MHNTCRNFLIEFLRYILLELLILNLTFWFSFPNINPKFRVAKNWNSRSSFSYNFSWLCHDIYRRVNVNNASRKENVTVEERRDRGIFESQEAKLNLQRRFKQICVVEQVTALRWNIPQRVLNGRWKSLLLLQRWLYIMKNHITQLLCKFGNLQKNLEQSKLWGGNKLN